VYASRPVVCRLHQAVSDPKLCETAGGQRIDVDGLMADHAAFARSAASHEALASLPALGPMPLLVLGELTKPSRRFTLITSAAEK
jgi:hypothetical protein